MTTMIDDEISITMESAILKKEITDRIKAEREKAKNSRTGLLKNKFFFWLFRKLYPCFWQNKINRP